MTETLVGQQPTDHQELPPTASLARLRPPHYSFIATFCSPGICFLHRPGHRGPDGRGGRRCGGAGAGVTDLLPVGRTGPANH